MNQNVLTAHVYVLGHVGVRKIVGEIPSHPGGGGGLGASNKAHLCAPRLLPQHVCTLSEHFYPSKSRLKERTMEALRWRKSDRRASRGLALVRGRCVSYKECLELAGDLIPFPVSGGERRGTKQGRQEPEGADCFVEKMLFQLSRKLYYKKVQ